MNHQPRKRFGQHFLHDQSVIRRIVGAIPKTDQQRVVEIGPGLGALTEPLIERFGSIDAIEIDRDAAAALTERFDVDALTIHNVDILKFDFAALADGRRLMLVGNLPYNISTPLLFHVLAAWEHVDQAVFMVQREVAERLSAKPGSKQYGRLTAMVAPFAHTETLFDVPPGAFNPPPKVMSSVFRLQPWASPPFPLANINRYRELVTQAFSTRRKTLRNALSGAVDVSDILSVGLDPAVRPDQLAPADYARLADL